MVILLMSYLFQMYGFTSATRMASFLLVNSLNTSVCCILIISLSHFPPVEFSSTLLFPCRLQPEQFFCNVNRHTPFSWNQLFYCPFSWLKYCSFIPSNTSLRLNCIPGLLRVKWLKPPYKQGMNGVFSSRMIHL